MKEKILNIVNKILSKSGYALTKKENVSNTLKEPCDEILNNRVLVKIYLNHTRFHVMSHGETKNEIERKIKNIIAEHVKSHIEIKEGIDWQGYKFLEGSLYVGIHDPHVIAKEIYSEITI